MLKRILSVFLIVFCVVGLVGGIANADTKPKLIGVDNASGKIKSVETQEINVFVVIVAKDGDRAFYIDKNSEIATKVLGYKTGDNVDIKYALGTPVMYKELAAAPLSDITKVTVTPTIKPILKPIGVDSITGKVNKIYKTKTDVFLEIKPDNSKELRLFYIDINSKTGKSVMKLKVKTVVTVKYALGTPKKYKEKSAFPLSSVSVNK